MEQSLEYLIGDDVFGNPLGTVAVMIHKGLISGISRISDDDATKLVGLIGESVLDCRGKIILPGLGDAHIHAIASGMVMLSTRLQDVTSVEQLVAAIETEMAKGRDVVRSMGLDPSRLQKEELSKIDRKFLDGLSAEKPLFIKSVEGHSGWFNTAAWKMISADVVLDRLEITGERREKMFSMGRIYGEAFEHLTTPLYDSFHMQKDVKE